MLFSTGLVVFSSSLAIGSAQSSIEIEQQVEYTYGQHVTFRAVVPGATSFASAHIVVRTGSASAILDKDAVQVPESPGTWRVDAEIADIGLAAFAQLKTEWQFFDSAGGSLLSTPATFLYEDRSVPWTWKTEQLNNAVVHWDGIDSNMAVVVLDLANSAEESARELLGVQPTNDIVNIYVYRDLASMAAALRLHRQRVNDAVAAFAFPQDQIILVASGGDVGEGTALKRDISHEMAHIVVQSGSGQHIIPAWFNEGVAILVSSDTGSTSSALQDAVNAGILLSIDPLCADSFSGLRSQDAALAYAESASLVKYINDRYGPSQISAILNSYRSGLSCSDGIFNALGITLTDLENQWHADLATGSQGNAEKPSSALPWLIIWIGSLILAGCLIMPALPRREPLDSGLTHAHLVGTES